MSANNKESPAYKEIQLRAKIAKALIETASPYYEAVEDVERTWSDDNCVWENFTPDMDVTIEMAKQLYSKHPYFSTRYVVNALLYFRNKCQK